MPRFSIIIPCFNAEATIDETLEAIASQSIPDFEVICVDDGSTDHTAAKVRRWTETDPRIRLVRHDGKGPSAARNAGAILHATGDILAFCDADDVWLSVKLARLTALFENGADAVFGKVGFYTGDASLRMRMSTVPGRPLEVASLLAENAVCTMSNIAVTRAWFDRVGGFREDLHHNEDLDWLIRLAGAGARIVGDDHLHVLYRTASRGLSADIARMQEGRAIALETAGRFGVRPSRHDDAVFARYMTRRALRLNDHGWQAFRYMTEGLLLSPRAFLLPVRRGLPTAIAAALSPILPRALRRAAFSA